MERRSHHAQEYSGGRSYFILRAVIVQREPATHPGPPFRNSSLPFVFGSLAALRALTAICSVNSHRNRCYDTLLEPGTALRTQSVKLARNAKNSKRMRSHTRSCRVTAKL